MEKILNKLFITRDFLDDQTDEDIKIGNIYKAGSVYVVIPPFQKGGELIEVEVYKDLNEAEARSREIMRDVLEKILDDLLYDKFPTIGFRVFDGGYVEVYCYCMGEDCPKSCNIGKKIKDFWDKEGDKVLEKAKLILEKELLL
jgi:hypothetical protein